MRRPTGELRRGYQGRVEAGSIGVGDRVTVEISPYDLGKGRLVFRHKDESSAPPPSGASRFKGPPKRR